jgi:hypothetical protein
MVAPMTVYVSAPELPLVLACTDADVDSVIAEIGHWASAGLTNVFRSDGDPSFVVNFGRVTAFTIGTQPDRRDAGKAVFPIEIDRPADARRVQEAISLSHGHDHDH